MYLQVLNILSTQAIAELSTCMAQRRAFPTKLDLRVDLATLTNATFNTLLQELNGTAIVTVKLIFTAAAVQQAEESLAMILAELAATIAYPLQIYESYGDAIIATKLALADFEQQVIANIQTQHRQDVAAATAIREVAADPRMLSQNPLKRDIFRGADGINNQAPYAVPLQVEILEVQHDVAAQAIQEYDGQLLGFAEFKASEYRNRVLALTCDKSLTDDLYALLQ